MKYKYVILGAGPAGLTFANYLKQKRINNFLVIEKEKNAGGLCKSVDIDGYPLDTGGGHFLDADNSNACKFLFRFLSKKDWNEFNRKSKIELNNDLIDHPLEANIWQLPIELQIEYLKSIAIAGCNLGKKLPLKFVDWIYWKLGKRIAEDYMIPYNKKIFCDELNQLGTYWLSKLPSVSFQDTLLSCINKKAYGKEPGHTTFYYPKKYGYGELWTRMQDEIKKNLILSEVVTELDVKNRSVKLSSGSEILADTIISTIPWNSFVDIKGLSRDIKLSIKKLKHSSIVIKYFDTNLNTDAHWIYCPDLKKSYHRILVRSTFAERSKGYWTETNLKRFKGSINNKNVFVNEYAYPLNTISKPVIIYKLLNYIKKYRIHALGRWGEHEHYNSDKVVDLSLLLAKKMLS